MGSRAKRAREAGEQRAKDGTQKPPRPTGRSVQATPAAPVRATPYKAGDKPPVIRDVDVAFGSINHMPRYETIPSDFKQRGNPYCEFISDWFFGGRNADDMARLKEREGTDRAMALRAIRAIMKSWAPRHEHKVAACAYLLSEWFVLDGKP